MRVKVKGRPLRQEEYDEIIEENELITVDYWDLVYESGVNMLTYEAMIPGDYDDWDYNQMNEYIKDAVLDLF